VPLTTKCAHCGRLVPVYAQDLRARRSRVSCPNCGNPFNALAGLIDEPRDTDFAAGAALRSGTPSAGAGHPWPGVTSVQTTRSRRASRLATIGLLTLSLVLALTLAGQAAWWHRGDLLRHPHSRGWLEAACARLGCTLPTPRIAGTLELLDPRLSAPNAGGGLDEPPDQRRGELQDEALTLSLRIRNAASLPQPPPRIDLELFDLGGELIAARRFAPADYGQAADRLMGPGEVLAVELAFVPPGVETSGFKVRLL
jgi:hypothetical protein